MKLDSSTLSLVLVGKFSPGDFSIESFVKTHSIGDEDAAQARYEAFVRDQVCDIRFHWGKFAVVDQKLVIEVNEAPYIRASDLALKCLRELSQGAVVRQMGINYQAFFAANSEERDAVGRRLVPPKNWGMWGNQVAESLNFGISDPRHGGMTAAALRQGKPDDRPAGHIDARVEPANRDSVWGVLVSINDHYEMPKGRDGKLVPDRTATGTLLDALEEAFDKSVARSIEIARQIMAAT